MILWWSFVPRLVIDVEESKPIHVRLQQILIHEKTNKSTFSWICVLQTLQPIEHTMCRSRTITSENFASKISLATHFMTAILEPFNENGSNCGKKLNQLKNLQVSEKLLCPQYSVTLLGFKFCCWSAACILQHYWFIF